VENKPRLWKPAAAAVILSLFFQYSCSPKPSLEKRLASNDTKIIKAAITDAWRLGREDLITVIADFLENRELGPHAAFALSLLDPGMAASAATNRISSAKNREAHLFCLYLISKNHSGTVPAYVRANEAGFEGAEKYAADMILTVEDPGRLRGVLDAAEAGRLKGSPLLKEFALLLGEKRVREAVPFLEKLAAESKEASAHASWALSRIREKKGPEFDVKERFIKSGGFFERDRGNPVLPVVEGTYKSWHTANPDILLKDGMMYYYYRAGDGRDRIALATVPLERFDGKTFYDYEFNPIIDIGRDSFDDMAVLDPAAVVFNNKVFLYYSGLGKGEDSVGLAVSKNYYNFSKYKKNPVITGRAPEVVLKDGIIYMYYVLPNPRGGYTVHLATSDDGYRFEKFRRPVFEPASDIRAWDGKTVTVPRIVEKEGMYYMLYAGDNRYMDYPPFFGLAFSHDLVNWHRSGQNPLFSRGEEGAFDEGAIWYGQLFEHGRKWYLWYEGWGGGESREKEYGPGGRSQIGLAISGVDLRDML